VSEDVRLILGDALKVLPTLEAGSVDCVLTDPPYPCIKRPYGYWTEAEWFALMNPVVEQCRRVLKPTGSAVFILQPNSERLGRMRTWLWEFMAKWGKEWGIVQDVWWWNCTAPPTAHAQRSRGLTRPSLKACVWLGDADCYRNQDAVLWSESDHHVGEKAAERFDRKIVSTSSGHQMNRARCFEAAKQRGGVTPFNLLPVPNQHSKDNGGLYGHGAATPKALCCWWTRYIAPPEGIILDPFGGSGTVGLAALQEGRNAVLIERNAEYVAIAQQRIKTAQAEARSKMF
jgi:DNA modification methylase